MFGFSNMFQEIDKEDTVNTTKDIPVVEELPEKSPVIIQGFKAFNSDMQCRDFQYEENKLFTYDGNIDICKRGFHFCEEILDCYSYYPLNSDTIICKVESLGEIKREEFSSTLHIMNYNLGNKTVTNKLFIKEKLSKIELLEYLLNNKYGLSTPINKELFTSVSNYLGYAYWDENIIKKAIADLSLKLFFSNTLKFFKDNGFTDEQSFELLKIKYAKYKEN